MPHDVIWIWSMPRIEDLIASYADQREGSDEAPMLYVAMSPEAVLSFMRSMGAQSVAAMVRMPGQRRPTELPINPAPERPRAEHIRPQIQTWSEEVLVDKPSMQDQVALAMRGCSQCGQPWEEWACGPTHASLRNEMGIEPKSYSVEQLENETEKPTFLDPMPQVGGTFKGYKPIDLGPMEITSEPVRPVDIVTLPSNVTPEQVDALRRMAMPHG